MIGRNATLPITTCKDQFLHTCDHLMLDPDRVHHAFRNLGVGCLKPKYQHAWSYDRPTTNFCYVAAEYVYWYKMKGYYGRLFEKGWGKLEGKSRVGVYRTFIPSKNVTHWFVAYTHYHGFDYVYDLTADQFDDYDEYMTYCQTPHVKRTFFFQSGFVGPSARAQLLANELGHEIDEWCYTKIPNSP